uniref:hypothetical protein n=1 Tax=Cutleria multifida TaxID=74475 RepID=UPI002E76327C|nr:hypothetical protein V2479_pgp005 [Cutleria multifida]WAM62691.1 hypothetical protein [Cutleria multifida]
MKKEKFYISLYLNGYRYKIVMTEPSHIFHLLDFLNYQEKFIIVEHNGKINYNLKYKPPYIKHEDKIEIITIVGGG